MRQPIRNYNELPEALRKRIESYGLTNKLWSGVLIISCSYPYCLVESEDPNFMIRHAQDHGIHPTLDEPAESKPEDVIHQGETLIVEASSSVSENEERND